MSAGAAAGAATTVHLIVNNLVDDQSGRGYGGAMSASAAIVTPDPRAIVLNVQGYSIHDGPGIRTTVFLKGCPLRCLWCHNPESQRQAPEVAVDPERLEAPGSVMGRERSASELFDEVIADAPFYRQSGGGVTLSGGEPLAQPAFAAELLRRCHEAGIHTVLDTCGHAQWSVARRVLAHVDLVLFDFKHMDPEAHRRLTGVDNRRILDNARRIHHELGLPLHARVPVIPGFNDSADNLDATARFIADELAPSVPVCLHAYHRLGAGKYQRLGRGAEFLALEPPDDARMQWARSRFEALGLAAVIGEYPAAVAEPSSTGETCS